jgi:hypothetical protein
MSKSVTGYKNEFQDQYPISRAEVRNMILEAAGFTPNEAALIMRKAMDKMLEKLEATKTQFFAFEGRVMDERELVDHGTQLKAAEDLAALGVEIMGLKQAASKDNPPPTRVNIDLSGWQVTPGDKDVTVKVMQGVSDPNNGEKRSLDNRQEDVTPNDQEG